MAYSLVGGPQSQEIPAHVVFVALFDYEKSWTISESKLSYNVSFNCLIIILAFAKQIDVNF